MESTVVKEIRRNTAACEACQERKRKCDGKAPCSFISYLHNFAILLIFKCTPYLRKYLLLAYCVGKKIECKFSQQKKRGPSKKRRMIEAEAGLSTTLSLCSPSPQTLSFILTFNYIF
jgi:hypothetical protein